MSYEIIIYIVLFIFGLFFGSFLNVVADRSSKGESFVGGRSHCEHCNKTLGIKNLIPLLSYIFQKGKCSNCGEKLSLFYPVSELITGLVLVVAAMYSGIVKTPDLPNILYFVLLAGSFSFLIILFLADAKYQLLPDKIILPAILFVFFMTLVIYGVNLKLYYDKLNADTFGKYLLEAGFWKMEAVRYIKGFLVMVGTSLGISLFFFLLIILTKGRGMGGGDVKLGLLIGLFNGVPFNLLAIFIGFVIGAIYSSALIIFKRKSLKDTIAFGPFLILGSIIAFFWGNLIISWYLKFL